MKAVVVDNQEFTVDGSVLIDYIFGVYFFTGPIISILGIALGIVGKKAQKIKMANAGLWLSSFAIIFLLIGLAINGMYVLVSDYL